MGFQLNGFNINELKCNAKNCNLNISELKLNNRRRFVNTLQIHYCIYNTYFSGVNECIAFSEKILSLFKYIEAPFSGLINNT